MNVVTKNPQNAFLFIGWGKQMTREKANVKYTDPLWESILCFGLEVIHFIKLGLKQRHSGLGDTSCQHRQCYAIRLVCEESSVISPTQPEKNHLQESNYLTANSEVLKVTDIALSERQSENQKRQYAEQPKNVSRQTLTLAKNLPLRI